MSDKKNNDTAPMYRRDKSKDVLEYVARGEHAFIGCDNRAQRAKSVSLMRDALAKYPLEYIDGNQAESCRDFAISIVEACQRLIAELGVPLLQRNLNISSSLEEAMQIFESKSRQGFLIANDIDSVIQMQNTFEIEGPLRSVMQRYDDVAVVLCGTNETINKMVGDYERPFYMSFRVFRL